MIVDIQYDITNCTDCPFKYNHRGHGECWTECLHKENGRKYYDNILWGCQEDFTKIPDWCPLPLTERDNNDL